MGKLDKIADVIETSDKLKALATAQSIYTKCGNDPQKKRRVIKSVMYSWSMAESWREKIEKEPDLDEKQRLYDSAVRSIGDAVCGASRLDRSEFGRLCGIARRIENGADEDEQLLRQNFGYLLAVSSIIVLPVSLVGAGMVTLSGLAYQGFIESHVNESRNQQYSDAVFYTLLSGVTSLKIRSESDPLTCELVNDLDKNTAEDVGLNLATPSSLSLAAQLPPEVVEIVNSSSESDSEAAIQSALQIVESTKTKPDTASIKVATDFSLLAADPHFRAYLAARKIDPRLLDDDGLGDEEKERLLSEYAVDTEAANRFRQGQAGRHDVRSAAEFMVAFGGATGNTELQSIGRIVGTIVEIDELVARAKLPSFDPSSISNLACSFNTATVAVNLISFLSTVGKPDPVMEAISAVLEELRSFRKEVLEGLQGIHSRLTGIFEGLLEVLDAVIETRVFNQQQFDAIKEALKTISSDALLVDRENNDKLFGKAQTQFEKAFDRLGAQGIAIESVDEYDEYTTMFYERVLSDAYSVAYSGNPKKQLNGNEFVQRVKSSQDVRLCTGLIPYARKFVLSKAPSHEIVSVEQSEYLPNLAVLVEGANMYLSSRVLVPQVNGPTYENSERQLERNVENVVNSTLQLQSVENGSLSRSYHAFAHSFLDLLRAKAKEYENENWQVKTDVVFKGLKSSYVVETPKVLMRMPLGEYKFQSAELTESTTHAAPRAAFNISAHEWYSFPGSTDTMSVDPLGLAVALGIIEQKYIKPGWYEYKFVKGFFQGVDPFVLSCYHGIIYSRSPKLAGPIHPKFGLSLKEFGKHEDEIREAFIKDDNFDTDKDPYRVLHLPLIHYMAKASILDYRDGLLRNFGPFIANEMTQIKSQLATKNLDAFAYASALLAGHVEWFNGVAPDHFTVSDFAFDSNVLMSATNWRAELSRFSPAQELPLEGPAIRHPPLEGAPEMQKYDSNCIVSRNEDSGSETILGEGGWTFLDDAVHFAVGKTVARATEYFDALEGSGYSGCVLDSLGLTLQNLQEYLLIKD